MAATLGGLFLALAAYQVWGAKGFFALRRKLREEQEWQQRNVALRRENEALEKRIHDLRTDPKAIEKIAREEYMLAAPGETVLLAPRKK
ncbi:MAG TPA: septum formation initiator family protein [Bryobacterales bacterium]|nr:septum formation initiator family protein [Bryobacterales bacterium]